MAFLSGKALVRKLKSALSKQFDESNIDGVAYELCLGEEYFITDSKEKQPEYLDKKKRNVKINPGQCALLLTKEYIELPKDCIGFISIKASEKFKGLVNVSGFHVDPGFKGNLLFAVYNAGPSPISLTKDKKYFKLWISDLTEEVNKKIAYNEEKNHHQNQSEIPTRYFEFLNSGELASPSALSKRIEKNKNLVRWLIGLATTVITIGIGFTTLAVGLVYKSWNKSSSFDEGYYIGKKEKAVLQLVENEMLNINVDSIIQAKIDSIKIGLIKQKTVSNELDSIILEVVEEKIRTSVHQDSDSAKQK